MSDCKTCDKWNQYEGCVMGLAAACGVRCDHYEPDERLYALRARAEKAEAELARLREGMSMNNKQEEIMEDRITVNGIDYIRADSRPTGKRAVVVVDRGWIFAGDITEENGRIRLSRAVWVYRWTGGQGFAAVIEHPELDSDIRTVADVDLPADAEIFRVPVRDDWGL
jgi:hypothetical protein